MKAQKTLDRPRRSVWDILNIEIGNGSKEAYNPRPTENRELPPPPAVVYLPWLKGGPKQ